MSEINPQRLMKDLRHLRTIGKYGTGVVRPAFSTKDMEARQWLLERIGQAGLRASMDGVGNVFGRSPNPGKGILIGSHTDTQPQGGWLDGSLGVLYGLEIMRAFAEDQRSAHFAVDVASWSDEEGTYLSMLGNEKPDPARNIRPDENYARELMQLFSVGLIENERRPNAAGLAFQQHLKCHEFVAGGGQIVRKGPADLYR